MGIYTPIIVTEEIELSFKPTRLTVKELSGVKYFCKTTRKNIEKYPGSGIRWINHVKKHGKENINTLWVSDWFYCPHYLQHFALMFSEYNQIVESDEWANLMAENGLSGGKVVNNYLKLYNKIGQPGHTSDSRLRHSNSQLRNTHAQKRVEIDGIIFPSINDAAKFYKKSGPTINQWMKKGKAKLVCPILND